MKLFSSFKVVGAIGLNLGLFGYALRRNQHHEQSLRQMPDTKKFELNARDFALRNDSLYQSESPYLRAIAIKNYNNNLHFQIKAKHQYLEHVNQEAAKAKIAAKR